MAKPIFLLGYMGCGKSTVGKKLATKLRYTFIDIDQTIEELTGKSIDQIFSEEGESAFRQLERSMLISMTSRKNIVVSTGGGAPCFFDNMAMMNKTGLTIYIIMHPESLAKRLIDSPIKRPLLSRVQNSDLPNYIAKHLKEREVYYSKAHVKIKGENLKIDDLYLEVLHLQ